MHWAEKSLRRCIQRSATLRTRTSMAVFGTLILVIALLLTLMASPGTVHALGATFTVNSTGDAPDANPGDGVAETAPGNGIVTLRAAIQEANALVGNDTIAFNIPGAGPHTIQPTSTLPTITDPVIIDGYTQPGASPNTNPPGLGINAVLKIELDGSNAGGAHGLRIAGGNSTVRGLVINRFGNGVLLQANGDNVIEGNFIGTDITGTVDLGNFAYGVFINVSSSNTIGGTTPGARNVISGNDAGVRIDGNAAENLVQGNFIGTDVNGIADLGNFNGVEIFQAPNNTIGGTTVEARNVISGNGQIGVVIGGNDAMGNLVQGNFIGADVTGTADLGNTLQGVQIFDGLSNTIGGTTPGARNVISGNDGGGVRILGSATGNLVQGNFIGTDVTGTADLGNSDGVVIHAPSNSIGGITPGAGNVISGNGFGVIIMGSEATGNLVQGNLIGTDVHGTGALGNVGGGVWIVLSHSNTIGGTTGGAGNTIAFNGGDGVTVGSGTSNAVLANSIFSNTGLGIDLFGFDGVTSNDPGDDDTGANNLQNFPVLTSATSDSGTTVEGALNSTPSTEFRLEFFSNSACDPSGHGEGEAFLGSTNVTTNGSGNVSFTVTFPDTVPVGYFITATATDPGNNTSEFSQCVQVTAEVQPVEATVDFEPSTLNLKSRGKYVTAYIELSEGYDVNDIEVGTVLLNYEIESETKWAEIGDHNANGISDVMVKFNRSEVQNILDVGHEVEITITGEVGGITFEGSDTIRVIDG